MKANGESNDFFSSMMFGRREPTSDCLKNEEQEEEQDLAGTDQLLLILALIQAIQPIFDQIKPLFISLVSSLDNKKSD
ncbi:hypothetical protein [Shouchella patagoniensis]|uniref:hypothetical protein n=1 Tax=Shouchella patagoniensis TaxID=228576 RepID=UPI000994A69B|nr:hypothetical protein [Shouchella patagoniensis]